MKNRLLPLFLFCALLAAAACSAEPIPLPTQTPPPGAGPTQSQSSTLGSSILGVMAADSLTGAFTELGQVFEAAHPGIKVTFYFVGSPQANPGTPQDVIASDSTDDMNAEVQAGLVSQNASKVFVHNKLVVIYPTANPAGISKLQDLAKAGLKVELVNTSTPVGSYTQTFLSLASTDPAFTPTFVTDVQQNVASFADTSSAVVSQVTSGAVEAGICYVTDVTPDLASKVTRLEIPDALNVTAEYSIAALAKSQNPALAQAFVDLVLSAQGQQVMAKYGFIPTNP